MDYFQNADSSKKVEPAKPGNDVKYFIDNKKYFSSILDDLLTANGKNDFVYIVNWWCDIDLPLGDPVGNPKPITLRQALSNIAAPKILEKTSSTFSDLPELIPGTQVCALLWQRKDAPSIPGFIRNPPFSIFGPLSLNKINDKSVEFISSLPNGSKAFTDGAHRLLGSHHQKFIVIKNESSLIAYVGSMDFNADRLYSMGSSDAKNPPQTSGAPLEDVGIRIVGPSAGDVLKTFVDRWKLHIDGRAHTLRGESYVNPGVSRGNVIVQIAHTYGKNYPFKGLAVTSAADAILIMVLNAKEFIYFEDQYLIGTIELKHALQARLNSNLNLHVIGVMAPLDIVSDMPWVNERRSNFWRELIAINPNRIMIFEMTNKNYSTTGDGAYLHAKLVIVDDIMASIGSVNCSNRSWYHDSEISAIVRDSTTNEEKSKSIIFSLRLERWSRHQGIRMEDIVKVNDGVSKWKILPSTALVKKWTPIPINKNYQYPIIEIDHDRAYRLVIDPE